MIFALDCANIPDTVVVEAMLQEIVWVIEDLDEATAKAAAMRDVISWFSDQCALTIALLVIGLGAGAMARAGDVASRLWPISGSFLTRSHVRMPSLCWAEVSHIGPL